MYTSNVAQSASKGSCYHRVACTEEPASEVMDIV